MIGFLSQLYASSLLATVPLAIAWLAALLLARTPAGTRLLVWRAAIASLLLIFAAQLTPFRWAAGVVPAGLAQPLVTLGRMQVGEASSQASRAPAILLGAWVVGVVLVLRPMVVGWLAMRRIARASASFRGNATSEGWAGPHRRLPHGPAQPPLDALPLVRVEWLESLDDARRTIGVSREVELLVSAEQAVPVAVGVRHAAVIIPESALALPAAHRRALLLHELSHVQSRDVAWSMLGRVANALFWFHPLAWLATQELHATCELARDDRVLAAGVKQSEYAELLLTVADTVGDAAHVVSTVALARGPLRERLHAVLTPDRDLSAAGPARVIAVAALTVAISLPLGALRPTPTRDVLTTLMHDARWDMRAYAVTRLAQRADSVALARHAAATDPSPRVRAIATRALVSSAVAEDQEPSPESRGLRFR